MTHPSSNDPQTGNPQNPATPDMPTSDRPLPPLPAPDRATNPRELPALPPLPERDSSVENKELPSLPKPGDASGGLPPLPEASDQDVKSELPPEAETTDNGEKPALPALPVVATTEKQPVLPPLPKPGDTSDGLPPLPGALDQDVKPQLPSEAETTDDGGEKPALPTLPVAATTEKQPVLPPLPKPGDTSDELPPLPGALDQDVKPQLPGGAETTDNGEKPALPALPVIATTEEQSVLPPLPKPSEVSTGLPPLPSTPKSEDPENVIRVDLAPPSLSGATPVGDSDVTKPVEDQEIKAVIPAASSQGSDEEEQPAVEAVVVEQAAPALTDEQQFVLSLSPHEMLTIIEGCDFLPISVAMADGEVDQNEKEAGTAAFDKFMGLFESADSLVDEQFETRFMEQQKETGNLDSFRSKFAAAQDEAETKKLVTYFMADFSKVLEKAPESVSQKIKDHIRESCLEVAEASGEGAGANICGAEAVVIGELLGLLEIELDEETQSRIFGSLEKQSETDSAELEPPTDTKEAELEALKEKLSAENETFRYLNGLSEQQKADFWFGLISTPGLVAHADGEKDKQELVECISARCDLEEGIADRIFPNNELEECDSELVDELLLDLQLKQCLGAAEQAVLRGDELVVEGTALERNQKIVDLLEEFKTLLTQAPDSLQASLKEWILESSVKVAEASGSNLEGDDKIGIEERQLLVTLFKELDLDYQGTPLEARLNIDQEDQDFQGYLSTLNAEDRIRILALPHVLVEIVAASDGKIDAQEAMAITPILKREAKALDPEFPVVWRENLADVQKFGKGLTAEFQDLQGTKAQLEWVFGLLDGYWKILETMPSDLQERFRTSILTIVTEVAEVSGDGGVAGNIGVEEELLIDIICESLGIEREANVTELEVD